MKRVKGDYKIHILCLYCPKLDKRLLMCKLHNPFRSCVKKRVKAYLQKIKKEN